MAVLTPTAAEVEQEGVETLRRAARLSARYEISSERGEPLTMRHLPTGQEFMLEVRALPMGTDD